MSLGTVGTTPTSTNCPLMMTPRLDITDQLHPLTHVIAEALRSLQVEHRHFPAVVEWACPVPFFGRAEFAEIASVGLNPSGREFRDRSGRCL